MTPVTRRWWYWWIGWWSTWRELAVYASENPEHSSISMEGVQRSQCAIGGIEHSELNIENNFMNLLDSGHWTRTLDPVIGSSLGAIQGSPHICHWHHFLERSASSMGVTTKPRTICKIFGCTSLRRWTHNGSAASLFAEPNQKPTCMGFSWEFWICHDAMLALSTCLPIGNWFCGSCGWIYECCSVGFLLLECQCSKLFCSTDPLVWWWFRKSWAKPRTKSRAKPRRTIRTKPRKSCRCKTKTSAHETFEWFARKVELHLHSGKASFQENSHRFSWCAGAVSGISKWAPRVGQAVLFSGWSNWSADQRNCRYSVQLELGHTGLERSWSASPFATYICSTIKHQDLERRRFSWPTSIICECPRFTCKLLVQAKAKHGFFAESRQKIDHACFEFWACQQAKSASISKFSTQEAGYEFNFQPCHEPSKSKEMPGTRKEVWLWICYKNRAEPFDWFEAFGFSWTGPSPAKKVRGRAKPCWHWVFVSVAGKQIGQLHGSICVVVSGYQKKFVCSA